MSAPSAAGRDAQVIVVGGGPAGAATAWALARAGVDVLIVDRARFPRDKPCSEYLSPQASRILNEMGALSTIEASGPAHLTGMQIRSPNGLTCRGEFAAAHRFHGYRDRGLALRRHLLDDILLRQARQAGARSIEGLAVTDVDRDHAGRVTGIRIRTAGGRDSTARTLSAPMVVGADGLRSVVARRLGLTHAARWPRRIAFITHYRGVAGMGSAGEMHVDRVGYIGLADVGHGETNVALVVPASAARGVGPDGIFLIEQWIAHRPHLLSRFRHAERVTPVRAIGPFARRARRAWAPGAALVGDAADFFDPFTGQGIYAALRGGEMLAPYLCEALSARSARGADAALAAYDRHRRREFGGKWIVERSVGLAVAVPFLINRAVRVLRHQPDMADLLVGVTGDFVPPREVLRPAYLARLLLSYAPARVGGCP